MDTDEFLVVVLTPAQKRVIEDAKAKDRFQVRTYGMSWKTLDKLHSLGLVEKVPFLEDASKVKECEAQIKALCDLMKHQIDETDNHTDSKQATALRRIGDNIKRLLKDLSGTITVLTEKGRNV